LANGLDISPIVMALPVEHPGQRSLWALRRATPPGTLARCTMMSRPFARRLSRCRSLRPGHDRPFV